MIQKLKLRQWLSVLESSGYVISVDTSHFHAAGGLGKPVVGVFTFVNAKTYSRYYPKVELVQGPCPLKYFGCYSWGNCPDLKEGKKLPCCSGINSTMILEAFDKLVARFPIEDS